MLILDTFSACFFAWLLLSTCLGPEIMGPLREVFTHAAYADGSLGPRAMRTGGWRQRRREGGFGEGDADMWEMESMGRRGLGRA